MYLHDCNVKTSWLKPLQEGQMGSKYRRKWSHLSAFPVSFSLQHNIKYSQLLMENCLHVESTIVLTAKFRLTLQQNT